MDLSGEKLIEAPKEIVWAALNDPEILKACIAGCESADKVSDTELKATAAVKFGPIAAQFTGNVLLSDVDPPNGYTISGEGQGGVAGSASGNGKVALSDTAGGTLVSYQLAAQLAGRIGQLGDEVTNAAAADYAENFFIKFAAIVAPHSQTATSAAHAPVYHLAHEDHDHDPSNPHYFGLPLGVVLAGFVAIVSIGIVMAKFFL